MAREAMDVCLRVLKESNKSRFDSYSVRKSVLIISHITFRDCRVHSFSDNLSRNSCIQNLENHTLSVDQFNRELNQQRRRQLPKRHLKSEFALPQTLWRLFHLV